MRLLDTYCFPSWRRLAIFGKEFNYKNMYTSTYHFRIILALLFWSASPNGGVLGQSDISEGKNETKYVTQNLDQGLRIEHDGKITIGSDDKSIEAISNGGYLKIEKTTFGNSRSIFINNSGSGLNYEYREGGRVRPFEPEGKAWLDQIMPELLSNTTIGAESRIDRFYSKGGAKAVLGILPDLKNDHVRSRYMVLLMGKNIRSSEIPAVVSAVASNFRSDHYKHEVYRSVFPARSTDFGQLIRAVESMESDHFKALLLKPLFRESITDGQEQKALEMLKLIKSDHFKVDVAKNMALEKLSDKQLQFMVDQVVRDIKSDHFRYEMYKGIFPAYSKDVGLLTRAVESMESDHFKAQLLRPVFRENAVGGQQNGLELLKLVKSDHFKLDIAKNVVSDKLSDKQFQFMVEQVVGEIKSDHFKNEMLKTLIEGIKFTENRAILLLSATGDIQSDHFKTQLLKNVCAKQPTEKVKQKIREIAKASIKSSHFLGEVMRCAA